MRLTVILIFLLPATLLAQDVHFTRYNYFPQTTNPAMAGFFNGAWQFGGIYRNQWSSVNGFPYQTLGLRVHRKLPVKTDNIAFSLLALNDRAGPAALTQNRFSASFAYEKRWAKRTLAFGVQPAFSTRSIDRGSLPDQWNNFQGQFDENLNTADPIYNLNMSYFSLNAGLTYLQQIGKHNLLLGLSAYHINQPNESFFNDFENRLFMRPGLNARANIVFTRFFSIQPSLMVMRHNEATESSFGSLGTYQLDSAGKINVSAGIYVRNNIRSINGSKAFGNTDAINLLFGAGIGSFEIFGAYDFNTSSLNPASNYLGAFEIGLVYTIPGSVQVNNRQVPCIRY